MKEKVNSYFAVLLITITGAWATLTIVHVAYSNVPAFITSGSGGNLVSSHYLTPKK